MSRLAMLLDVIVWRMSPTRKRIIDLRNSFLELNAKYERLILQQQALMRNYDVLLKLLENSGVQTSDPD